MTRKEKNTIRKRGGCGNYGNNSQGRNFKKSERRRAVGEEESKREKKRHGARNRIRQEREK